MTYWNKKYQQMLREWECTKDTNCCLNKECGKYIYCRCTDKRIK